MLNPTTENLLDRIRSNDQAALKELFQAHYPEVCKAVYRFVRDEALMEDLAQRVFIRFWEKRSHLEINTSLQAYLYRMGVNEALAHLRKTKWIDPDREIPERSAGPTAEDVLLNQELGRHIFQAIETLPPKCQVIFRLSRYEELSYREIAEQLDISIKTVENQMGKALKLLREELKEYQ